MFALIRTDIKNILRDPSLFIICIVPFIMLAILRFGYPALWQNWPHIVIYIPYVLAMFCILVSAMPGFAIAFAILDEKDHNLQVVLHVLPISYSKITMIRIGVILLFGFLSSALLLFFSGIPAGDPFQILLLTVTSSLSAPIIALIPAFFARNKIEGATIIKMLNFLILLPLPGFLFPGWWTWLLAVFPTWWVYGAFKSIGNSFEFYSYIVGGFLFQTSVLWGVWMWVFRKK